VIRERSGAVRELRWLLRDRQAAAAGEAAGRGPLDRAAGGRPAPAEQALAGRDDLAGVLEEVVGAAATLLHADGAGLMLLYEDGGLRWVTATGSDELAFEQAQRDLGEGPCIDAPDRDEVVWSTDLPGDARWPAGRHLHRADQPATAVEPGRRWRDACLRHRARPPAGTATDASRKRELADQLQQALDRRVLIEQAKGVLIARMGVSADEAFALIRSTARSGNRRVADVAGDVIAGLVPER
jgi:ANTAR domain